MPPTTAKLFCIGIFTELSHTAAFCCCLMVAAKKLNFVKDEKSFVCVVWSMPSDSGLKFEKIVKITVGS